MPLPHLHIFHPAESCAPHLVGWLAEVQGLLAGDASWDGCKHHRWPYDLQASFHVPTAIGNVRSNPGPVIFIQKVQARLVSQFREKIGRSTSVYTVDPPSSTEIYEACEQARQAYDDGEPRIPARELTAFLIIAKLARQDKWGGTALNKSFLKASDLPKGGFPKDICTDREIQDVASTLYNLGFLTRKVGDGEMKYALGPKSLIQPILDSKTFPAESKGLQKYFSKGCEYVSIRRLDYRD